MLKSSKIKKNFRNWHTWLGVALALPLMIVGITTVFLSFEHQLNLDKYYISSNFIPINWIQTSKSKNELKTFYKDDKGIEYYGYKHGLIIRENNKVENIKFFDKYDIRKIIKSNKKLLVGTKNGLFLETNNTFKKILDADILDFQVASFNTYIITKNNLYNCTKDYLSCKKINLKINQNPITKISLKKLNMDFHTGKAIFGKSFEWLWQSLLGSSILFFMFSGFYLWAKKKSKK